MQVQQFIINFRETLRQELREANYYEGKQLLVIIDSCLLKAYIKENPDYDICIDD